MKYLILLIILFALLVIPGSAQRKEAVVEQPPADPLIYYYQPSSIKSERLYIDNTILDLNYASDSIAIVILRFKNLTTKQRKYRISRILNYLKRRKTKLADRFYFLTLKSDRDSNEILIRSKKDIPDCKDCPLIEGSDFEKLKRANKRK